jgi:hypothetical protein
MARLWWNLFDPDSGILIQFQKGSIILDGERKASRTKEKVLKILQFCDCKAEELQKAGSRDLPAPIAPLGATLLRKYKSFLEKGKAAAKKKATKDKRLQDAMNGYEVVLGMQVRAPNNCALTRTPQPCPLCTVTPPNIGGTSVAPPPVAPPLQEREATTATTPVVFRDACGAILGTTPLATFCNQMPGGVKETDAMTRSLLCVTSALEGHNKKYKASSDGETNVDRKISKIFKMETMARASGNFEIVQLLKKKQEALEETVLEE